MTRDKSIDIAMKPHRRQRRRRKEKEGGDGGRRRGNGNGNGCYRLMIGFLNHFFVVLLLLFLLYVWQLIFGDQ
ncbi:hypothetical protein Pyn_04141 [Prunus yedoensis var. nudiflora]|uniref:Transmembrane protein n=1 Tax=Prunus yedoensis var. nudiflora TaxID=2094558 RepID=A0A314UDJ5_PRUYE|nr:hypothetical protein Pyn_04141 [Prunus yedoensis var. nudiflora]